jgi:uncharacterized membrane protein YkvA (DUF1232 family)
VKDDLKTLRRFAAAYRSGEYRQVSRSTKVLAALTIAYLMWPIDLIPDFIPVVGYADDAALLALVLRRISGDLERFRAWEESRLR